MKSTKAARKLRRIRVPGKKASYQDLDRFFDQHDGAELIERGVMRIDPDQEDLERMLLEYWSQPSTKQLNIRIPPTARKMIEKLARRKTVEVSTLVRMWVIDGMRREAMQP